MVWHEYRRSPVACTELACQTRTQTAGNYWLCSACATARSLDTMISTLRGYDVQRHLSAKRMRLRAALPVSAELRRYQQAFVRAGGTMRVARQAPQPACDHGCCFLFAHGCDAGPKQTVDNQVLPYKHRGRP